MSIYPIHDCESCLHRETCKYIDIMNRIKQEKALPIDFDTAECLKYLDFEELSEYSNEDLSDCEDCNIEDCQDCTCKRCETEIEHYLQENMSKYDASINISDAKSIADGINKALAQLKEQGNSTFVKVTMCKSTRDALFKSDPSIFVVTKMSEYIKTDYGNLELSIDDSIPFGMFEITYL